MAKKSDKADAEAQGESIITSTIQKTAMGEIDTMTVAPRGDVTVDTGDQGDDEDNGVVITDKVAAREAAQTGDEKTDKNLQDDVGQKPKKKFSQTRDGRINTLTREKSDLLREIDELRGQKEKDEEEKQQLRRGKALSDHAAVEHYADALAAKMEAAERANKDALDAGDTEKASKAAKAMAEIAAKQEQVKAWKSANPVPEDRAEGDGEEKPAAKREAAPRKAAPPPPPETQRWVSENPWFDENSADFQPAMREEAQAFANLIETRLKRLGNAAAIGSRDYFNLIDKHMAETFPEAYGGADGGDDEEEQPQKPAQKPGLPRMSGASGVAPARSSATGRQPEPESQNPNTVRLTQEQREVAHGLILRHPNGQAYSNREKEVAYARGLKRTTQKGA